MPKLQKTLYPQKFNLIFYYAITSFVVIAVLTFTVGWIFQRMGRQALVKQSEGYTHYFISHLNYEIYKDFFLPTLRKDNLIDLKNTRRQLKKLDRIVREETWGLQIKKLYLYDLEGCIMYSTEHEHVGLTIARGADNKLDSALRGVAASSLSLAGKSGAQDSPVAETLIESCHPFYEMTHDGSKRPGWRIEDMPGYIGHEYADNQVVSAGDPYNRLINRGIVSGALSGSAQGFQDY